MRGGAAMAGIASPLNERHDMLNENQSTSTEARKQDGTVYEVNFRRAFGFSSSILG